MDTAAYQTEKKNIQLQSKKNAKRLLWVLFLIELIGLLFINQPTYMGDEDYVTISLMYLFIVTSSIIAFTALLTTALIFFKIKNLDNKFNKK